MANRKRGVVIFLGGTAATAAAIAMLASPRRARADAPVTGEPRMVRGRVTLPSVEDIEQESPPPERVAYYDRPGYDAQRARVLAGQLSRNMARNPRHGAFRETIRSFQRAAGIAADGHYGGTTYNALRYYGVQQPPAPHEPPDPADPAASYPPSEE